MDNSAHFLSFASSLAHMMGRKTDTAKRHITQASKIGVLYRAAIGS